MRRNTRHNAWRMRVRSSDIEAMERRVLLSAAVPLAPDAAVYNGHTYALVEQDGIAWADAEVRARQMGGHLATINDAPENDFVVAFIRQRLGSDQSAWIGFTDDAAYGGHEAGNTSGSAYPPAGNRGEGWVWSSGEPVTYQNWANDGPPQPDNGAEFGQNYGLINFHGSAPGTWDDEQGVSGLNINAAVVEIASTGPVTYEAEQASITGGVVSRGHAGFTAGGFVDYLNASGDSVEFTVQAPSAGRYELSFRYANGGTADRSTSLWVNGAAVPGGVTFARTGSWTSWRDVTGTVPLAAGSNKVRVLANGQSGPNLDSMSLRPVTPPASVTYQAESATLSGPLALSNVPGFTGTGFADYQHASGDYVEFPVDVPADGNYALAFRYANGSGSDRPLELKVDGSVLTGRASFGPTANWNTWKTVTQSALLTAGRHLVRLTAAGSGGPNLDALTVTAGATPPDAQPVTLQAESAALSGPIVTANHGGYTGTGFADYQNASGDSIEFTYDATAVGDYLLEFRYANGGPAARPLDLRVNGTVARPKMPFAPTGSWDTWSVTTATVALAAGTNRIRLTAAGQSGPNLDSLTVRRPGQTAAFITAAPGFSITWDGNEGDFRGAVPVNLARADQGAVAFADHNRGLGDTNEFPGLQIHHVDDLNDGLYGNVDSWISDVEEPHFAGVRFNGSRNITAIAWGRDNGTDGYVFRDRWAGRYTIQFTTVPTPDASTPDADWTTVGTVEYTGATGEPPAPSLRHRYDLARNGQPITATGVRLVLSRGGYPQGADIDEIEAFGT